MSASPHTVPDAPGAAARWPVVVTRDEPADGPLARALRDLGLTVLSWPVVQVLPLADPAALAAVLRRVHEFHWIVFTSRHGVDAVVTRLAAPAEGVRVAAVGESTAQALRDAGWPVSLVPEQHSAAGLVAALEPCLSPGSRVLYPAGSRSLPTLIEGLTTLGCIVTRLEAYRTVAADLDLPACRALVARAAIGAVTFTSPSAVHELDRLLGADCFEQLLSGSPAVTLGSTTGRALAARGFPCALAAPATLRGLASTTAKLIQLRA